MDNYFASYRRFETPSKKDAAVLLGADNLIGDRYEIEFDWHDDAHRAWMVSRFDQKIGYFDPSFSRQLNVYHARGMRICAILSFVAFTESPSPGHYWGEAAVFAYDDNPAFEHFIQTVARRMQDNVRTKIDFSSDGIQSIINSDGSWIPDQTVPMPKVKKGTVILKRRRSLSDKAIEQGRKGNKGCYIISWVFLLALVALIIYGVHALGVF